MGGIRSSAGSADQGLLRSEFLIGWRPANLEGQGGSASGTSGPSAPLVAWVALRGVPLALARCLVRVGRRAGEDARTRGSDLRGPIAAPGGRWAAAKA